MAKTKNIAIYGISANPITVGHTMVAQVVYSQCLNIDEVWISPCYSHQFGKDLAPADIRGEMVMKAVLSIHKGVEGWLGEITDKFTGKTWEFINAIKGKMSNHNFHIVVGYDNAVSLAKKWDHGEELIQTVPFIVVNRAVKDIQASPEDSWWLKPPHQYVDLQWQTSSTIVRDAIKAKNYKLAERHVHPLVWDMIKKHNLYGYE